MASLLLIGLSTGSATAQPDEDPETELDADEEGLENELGIEEPDEVIEEPEVVEAPKPKKSKGLVIETGDGRFKGQLQFRTQTRYTYEADTREAVADSRQFAARRVRLTLKGHAFSKQIKYKLQAGWDRGSTTLADSILDYTLLPDTVLRVGQFKKPFSRQQINSSSRLEFVDRPITNGASDAGRDIGVMLHNNYDASVSPPIEWALGVFNGTGTDVAPDGIGPGLVARVGLNRGGDDEKYSGYSEADLKGGGLRYSVAASAQVLLDPDDIDSTD
ncbi:MAG: porin, partial [Myxococcota bacterium]